LIDFCPCTIVNNTDKTRQYEVDVQNEYFLRTHPSGLGAVQPVKKRWLPWRHRISCDTDPAAATPTCCCSQQISTQIYTSATPTCYDLQPIVAILQTTFATMFCGNICWWIETKIYH